MMVAACAGECPISEAFVLENPSLLICSKRYREVFATVQKHQTDNPHCSACGDEMELTVLIPPFGSPHGLKVFTCPKCGRSEDYLVTSPSQAA